MKNLYKTLEEESEKINNGAPSKFVKEYVAKLNDTKEYRNSVQFDFDVLELKEMLTSNEEYPKMESLGIKIANALAQEDEHLWKPNEGCTFSELCCVYDGIKFCIMFGQGSSHSFSLVK
jgi:hypothetical protein